MLGPTHHLSSTYTPKDILWSGLRWINTLVPGGANRVTLKPKLPHINVYDDKDGLRLDDLNILNVTTAWGINLYQDEAGNLVLHEPTPAIR